MLWMLEHSLFARRGSQLTRDSEVRAATSMFEAACAVARRPSSPSSFPLAPQCSSGSVVVGAVPCWDCSRRVAGASATPCGANLSGPLFVGTVFHVALFADLFSCRLPSFTSLKWVTDADREGEVVRGGLGLLCSFHHC